MSHEGVQVTPTLTLIDFGEKEKDGPIRLSVDGQQLSDLDDEQIAIEVEHTNIAE